MRRTSLSVSIALGLALLSPIQTPAVQIAGTKCTKAGVTKTISNIKYTCIKQGKNLIWNKGVALKPSVKPTPKPTISPEPSPTSTAPAATNSSTPAPNPSPTPTKTPELSYSERWNQLETTALTVLTESNKLSVRPVHENIFIWQASDKAPPDVVDEIKKRYDFAGRWWANFAKSTNPIKILVGNINESEWICSIKLPWLGINQPDCVEIENKEGNVPTAGQSQSGSKQIDMYQMDSITRLSHFFAYGRIEHEFTHNIFYAQSTEYQRSVPCWLTEGGAETFGNLIAFHNDPNLYIQVRNFKVYTRQLKNQSTNDWFNYLNRADLSDVNPKMGDHCLDVRPEIYHHAILPNEYLIWKLGVAGYLSLIKEASTSTWAQAIQKNFGKSKSELYADIANYMKFQYDLIAANQWSINEARRIPHF